MGEGGGTPGVSGVQGGGQQEGADILPHAWRPLKGSADDGKRREMLLSMNEVERFILLLGEKKQERVWERKGLAIGPDRRLADDGKRLCGAERCILALT